MQKNKIDVAMVLAKTTAIFSLSLTVLTYSIFIINLCAKSTRESSTKTKFEVRSDFQLSHKKALKRVNRLRAVVDSRKCSTSSLTSFFKHERKFFTSSLLLSFGIVLEYET